MEMNTKNKVSRYDKLGKKHMQHITEKDLKYLMYKSFLKQKQKRPKRVDKWTSNRNTSLQERNANSPKTHEKNTVPH